MTIKQANWASEHDWYSHKEGINGMFTIVTKCGKRFYSYQLLREWAGY